MTRMGYSFWKGGEILRRGRRRYDAEDYFNFLYDMAFDDDDNIELAHILHDMTYEWYIPLDENIEDNGYEIRKYYLSDSLGYMPSDIDIYDEYIFPKNISVLEMFVGFSNKLCRDVVSFMDVPEMIEMFLSNLGILGETGEHEKFVKNIVKRWEMGDERYYIFEKGEKGDLWNKASRWLEEYDI